MRVLWGMRDRYLVPALAEGLEESVDDLAVHRLPEATHWLHHEQPARVGERIVGFLRESGGGA